ncbi:hypothetical protein ACU4HD_29670 [Cupriavidus basilensis]
MSAQDLCHGRHAGFLPAAAVDVHNALQQRLHFSLLATQPVDHLARHLARHLGKHLAISHISPFLPPCGHDSCIAKVL